LKGRVRETTEKRLGILLAFEHIISPEYFTIFYRLILFVTTPHFRHSVE
jgi:hypothetical protein